MEGFEKPQMKRILHWGANKVVALLSTIQNTSLKGLLSWPNLSMISHQPVVTRKLKTISFLCRNEVVSSFHAPPLRCRRG